MSRKSCTLAGCQEDDASAHRLSKAGGVRKITNLCFKKAAVFFFTILTFLGFFSDTSIMSHSGKLQAQLLTLKGETDSAQLNRSISSVLGGQKITCLVLIAATRAAFDSMQDTCSYFQLSAEQPCSVEPRCSSFVDTLSVTLRPQRALPDVIW